MSLTVKQGDHIGLRTDSLNAGVIGNGMQWGPYLQALIAAFYTGTTPPTTQVKFGLAARSPGVTAFDQNCPILLNLGHAGDSISAGDQTGLVPSLPTYIFPQSQNLDLLIIQMGINDCTVPYANATYQAALIAGINDINNAANYFNGNAPPRQIMLVGPLCDDEQLPFGTNPVDTTATGIAAKEAINRAQAVALGFDLLEFHDGTGTGGGNGIWRNYELIHNPTNLATGILTVDGRHLTTAGAQFMAQQIFARLILT